MLSFQIETIRAILKKELEIPLVEIADANARLDGGDVLFTGEVSKMYKTQIKKWKSNIKNIKKKKQNKSSKPKILI